MNTPTTVQWQNVIDNFKKVLPQATQMHHLNMMEGSVNGNRHECGTVHCVGGWYAVAACDLSNRLSWDHGADRLAIDLGFTDRIELKYWAIENSDLWGNELADDMFIDKESWGNAKSLADIVKFLEAVRDRCTHHATF